MDLRYWPGIFSKLWNIDQKEQPIHGLEASILYTEKNKLSSPNSTAVLAARHVDET